MPHNLNYKAYNSNCKASGMLSMQVPLLRDAPQTKATVGTSASEDFKQFYMNVIRNI